MARFADPTRGVLSGVFLGRVAKVVDIAWDGSRAVTPTFAEEPTSEVGQELVYREDEARLMVKKAGQAWSMDADGDLFRLVSEARQISLACLFGAYLDLQGLALSSPVSDIGDVCEKMLPRKIFRFLLAESRGIRTNELMISGDVEHCLRAEAESPSRPAHAKPKPGR